MAQGVPGVPPPKFLQTAVGEASSLPSSFGYGSIPGEMAMREALVETMKAIYGPSADLNPQDISLTTGCNMAFIATIMAIADAGDEVILPVPW
jgi:aspartate/methionine/tyrosine aminotransferase